MAAFDILESIWDKNKEPTPDNREVYAVMIDIDRAPVIEAWEELL